MSCQTTSTSLHYLPLFFLFFVTRRVKLLFEFIYYLRICAACDPMCCMYIYSSVCTSVCACVCVCVIARYLKNNCFAVLSRQCYPANVTDILQCIKQAHTHTHNLYSNEAVLSDKVIEMIVGKVNNISYAKMYSWFTILGESLQEQCSNVRAKCRLCARIIR